MPLPQLRTDYNVLVPDRAKSSRDAVNALLGVQNMQARTANEKSQMENALVKRQEEKAAAEQLSESRRLDIEKKKLDSMNAKQDREGAIAKLFIEAGSPEMLERLKEIYPDHSGKWVGPEFVYESGDAIIKLSSAGHENLLGLLKKDPRALSTDPSKSGVPKFNESVWLLNKSGGLLGVTQKEQKRTDAEEIAYQGKLAEAKAKGGEGKQPTPVSWKNAADLVDRDFGSQDPMGNIIITPDNAGVRRIAREKLVELQTAGKGTPLAAVQESVKYARKQEKDFWSQMEDAKDNDAMKAATRKGFEQIFGYIPKLKMR